jgi:predicted ATPase
MGLTRVKFSNFRSFDEADIKLNPLNILIGANASGKSNFIQFFKFLKDVTNYGLENAVSMQGGAEYILNTRIGASAPLKVEVTTDILEKYRAPSFRRKTASIGIDAHETVYNFEVEFVGKTKRARVIEDRFRQTCNFYNFPNVPKSKKEDMREFLGSGEIKVDVVKGKPKLSMKLPPQVDEEKLVESIIELWAAKNMLFRKMRLKSNQLYLESSEPQSFFSNELGETLKSMLSGGFVYDFDPRLSKKPQLMTGKVELEPDGSNLAVVINNLLKNAEKSRRFYNLLSDLVPFVHSFSTENVADSVVFTLREKYPNSRPIPAFLLSDGTVNITSLIICLFFENRSLKVVEEPERNIHPYIISKVANLLKEASKYQQIITSTHNPELVRYSTIDDLLLVSRNKEGFSQIEKPADKERVKAFLEGEMGIDELYVQNLL